MAFYCTDSPKYATYVAKEGTDFVCFKQNIVNKKISKSLIVESKEWHQTTRLSPLIGLFRLNLSPITLKERKHNGSC